MLAGAVMCLLGLLKADTSDPQRFFLYLIYSNIAVILLSNSSNLDLLPVGSVVLLLRLGDISMAELLFIAFTVTLLHAQRKAASVSRLESLLFTLATLAIGIGAAQGIHRTFSLLKYNALFPAPVIASSFVLLLNCHFA